MIGWHHNSKDLSYSKLREIVKTGEPGMLKTMESKKVGHNLATDQQQRSVQLHVDGEGSCK